MGRAVDVPVTPSVLRWAIAESGYTPQEIATAVGVSLDSLEQWESDEAKAKPTLTQARRLATKLHRPLAALLLPAPPEGRRLAVEFRRPVTDQRELNPNERRHLRRAARLQEVVSWVAKELKIPAPQSPSASLSESPGSVAQVIRNVLGVSTSVQKDWDSPSTAFDEWRGALERTGYVVFLFSLGRDSCRGFSIWEDFAPLVAVNTAWNEQARVFTLFHELAHLVTRTSSACVESIRTSVKTDPVERWCERFAAEVLMPARDVEADLRRIGWKAGTQVTSLRVASSIADRYKVSLRATVIRLIGLNAASWALYDEIPPVADKKKPGGGGGGRSRAQIREDQFGDRVTSLLVNAVEKDVLSRSQAIDILDIPDAAFDDLPRTGRRSV